MEQERHLAAKGWSRQQAHAGGNKGKSAAARRGRGGLYDTSYVAIDYLNCLLF